MAGSSCSVRSVGCGGGDGDHATASLLRQFAVLAETVDLQPCLESWGSRTVISPVPATPARPPLDHPPRITC